MFRMHLATALVVGLSLLTLLTAQAGNPADVRVMSFNIRYGTANDGENHWDKRKEFVVETIRAFNPDLLGTQETLKFQRDYLAEHFPGYGYVAVGRNDGTDQGEMAALFYKKERFTSLESGSFWLSETPEIPGTKSWDSSLPRIVTWTLLFDRTLRKPVAFLNTHFDHLGQQARLESAKLLRTRALTIARGFPIIITGDFNAGEASDPYRALFAPNDGKESPVVDVYRVAHPERKPDEGTFSGFKLSEVSGARIDWIGASREWDVVSAAIDRTARDGRTPSDHFPVVTVLRPK